MPEPSLRTALMHLLVLEVPADSERWSAHDIASRSFPRRRALFATAAILLVFGVLVVVTRAVTGSVPPLPLLALAAGVAAGPLLAAEARPELVRRSPSLPPGAMATVAGLAVFASLLAMVAVTEATDTDCGDARPEEVAAVAQRLRPDAVISEATVVEDGQVRYLTARVTVGLEERVATWLVRVGADPAAAYVGVVGPEAAEVSVGLQPAPATEAAAKGAGCL